MPSAGKERTADSNVGPLRRRHLAAVVAGNALEFYDFTTYSFFALQIGHALFPARTPFENLMLSLATFGVGFLSRPLGGWLIGAYGDRAGRKPAMLLSFVLIGVAILGLAVIPSYAQIGIAAPILAVVARLVQGFALGGGVGPVSAFMLEAAPAGRRGLYSSLQYSSQGIAILAGGLVGTVLSNVLSDASLQAWGWRLAIGIGAIVLPFSFFLRRNLPDMLETPHAKEPKSNAGNLEIGSVRLVLLGFVMLTGSTITVYTLSFMTTYAQTTLRLPANVSFAASIMLGACTLLFCLISGWLSDRYGRKPVMIWPRAVLLIAVYPCFATLVAHPTAIALLTTTAIITTLNALSGTASFTAIAEGLPSRLRSGALGLVYALAISIFGGSAQPVLEGLIHGTGAMAPAWYLIAATAVALLAMLAMPESAPRISGRK